MDRKGYYSPALRRDLNARLYYAAKDFGVPMTVLHDKLVELALDRIAPRKRDANNQAEATKAAA